MKSLRPVYFKGLKASKRIDQCQSPGAFVHFKYTLSENNFNLF